MSSRTVTAGDIAVEFTDGLITDIGSSLQTTRAVEEIDNYPNGTMLAPLHDHHFHPIGYTAAVTRLSVNDATDFSDLAVKLRNAAQALGSGDALVVNRMDDERMAERRLPTRSDLDSMVSDRPVLLYRYCGHVAVANSAALAMAGVDSKSGILRETDIQPVANVVGGAQPPLPPDSVRRALSGLASLGLGKLTAIVSVGEPLWCEVPDEMDTLLGVASQLPLDLEVLVIAATPAELTAAAALLRSGPSNVSFKGWKDFADGALGGHTAALYEPFHDDPGNTGVLRLDHDHALEMARTCLSLEGTVAIHAIGDLANDRVLDLYEQLVHEGGDPTALRIEHASVLRRESIERMARLGVTASVQPSFISAEVNWLEKRLGDRARSTYALSALHDAGVAMLGGSDCPVESPNPWRGIAAAVDGGGLDRATAYGLFGDNLKVGNHANLIVVDRDPFIAADVAGTKVLAVYRSGSRIDLEPELPFI